MIFAYRSSILWSFIFKRRSLFRSYKIFVFLSPAFYLTWALIWWLHTELRAIVGPAYPVPSLIGIDITVVKEDLYIDTRVCVHTHTGATQDVSLCWRRSNRWEASAQPCVRPRKSVSCYRESIWSWNAFVQPLIKGGTFTLSCLIWCSFFASGGESTLVAVFELTYN